MEFSSYILYSTYNEGLVNLGSQCSEIMREPCDFGCEYQGASMDPGEVSPFLEWTTICRVLQSVGSI